MVHKEHRTSQQANQRLVTGISHQRITEAILKFTDNRQASNKFDTIEQGQRTVQELIQELTKYTA